MTILVMILVGTPKKTLATADIVIVKLTVLGFVFREVVNRVNIGAWVRVQEVCVKKFMVQRSPTMPWGVGIVELATGERNRHHNRSNATFALPKRNRPPPPALPVAYCGVDVFQG